MLDWMTDPSAWVGFLTLSVLEIVLGVDNIIFISILSSKLPRANQARAVRLGIGVALVSRLALLFTITWIMRLTQPLFTAFTNEISGRDLILLLGGLFLIGKATHELHNKLEGNETERSAAGAPSLLAILGQILIIDIVFSLDSVITAVGMVDDIWVMVAATVVAVVFMLVSAPALSAFVERHPTIKVLALAFLVVIGVNLIADGLGQHIPKGYTYFAMAFSVIVEMLNLRMRSKTPPVRLHEPHDPAIQTADRATTP